jgi:predicted DNA-binding protein (MmcQ/YjbR family)
MDVEQIRKLLLKLPNVVETMQWGENLVFWVGDKAIGGKMFAVANLEGTRRAVISFCAGKENYADLLECEGVFPAPYLARAYWVAIERWDVFRSAQWNQQLTTAHQLVASRLSRKTRDILALPIREQKRMISQKRAALAAKIST